MNSLVPLAVVVFLPVMGWCVGAMPMPDKGATPPAPSLEHSPQIETLTKAIQMPSLPAPVVVPSLCDAVATGDFELLRGLVEAGLDPNEKTFDGDTALTLALRLGADDMAAFLIFHGADANLIGHDNQTPLALSSWRRHPALLRLLLGGKADPNAPFAYPLAKSFLTAFTDPIFRSELKTERNVTPLMAAAARGDVESVTLLLKYGAKSEAHTLPDYHYPINYAAEHSYLYVMRLLLGRNPDSEPHTLITIDLAKQKCRLEVDGKEMLKTTISTGRRGYETPSGRYVITNKYKEWTSTIYKCAMPYFLRLNCSSIGLHAGYVTGEPASHGCIRLPEGMAKKFFDIATVGDEVSIER